MMVSKTAFILYLKKGTHREPAMLADPSVPGRGA